jgi:phytoene dehydrogenase-like protein
MRASSASSSSRNIVVGVVADGRELRRRTVVSAVDPKSTFLRLVDATDLAPDFRSKMSELPRERERWRRSTSPCRRCLRSRGAPAEALSGRIHIGATLDDMERAFDHVKYARAARPAWLDATIPSVLDPSLAPAGAHVMSIYVHYAAYRPALRGLERRKRTTSHTVLDTLERYVPRMRSLVVAAQVLTPADSNPTTAFSAATSFTVSSRSTNSLSRVRSSATRGITARSAGCTCAEPAHILADF